MSPYFTLQDRTLDINRYVEALEKPVLRIVDEKLEFLRKHEK